MLSFSLVMAGFSQVPSSDDTAAKKDMQTQEEEENEDAEEENKVKALPLSLSIEPSSAQTWGHLNAGGATQVHNSVSDSSNSDAEERLAWK